MVESAVDALIAADRDFDLPLLFNHGHGFANEPYMMRWRWDCFVRHLPGVEPSDHAIGAANGPVN